VHTMSRVETKLPQALEPLAVDSMQTPPLEAGTKLMGFPPWSRGPLLHRGEKRQLSLLVEHGDSNPVFDMTWFPREGENRS